MTADSDSASVAAREFLAKVRAENTAFYSSDRGRGSLRDLQQTFTHAWLYVGELLQNAVDARAKRSRTTRTEKPFSQ